MLARVEQGTVLPFVIHFLLVMLLTRMIHGVRPKWPTSKAAFLAGGFLFFINIGWKQIQFGGDLDRFLSCPTGIDWFQSNRFQDYLHDFVLWLLTLICSAAVWRVMSRRFHLPQCPTCGYNLTGNSSGMCPECGYVIRLQGKEKVR